MAEGGIPPSITYQVTFPDYRHEVQSYRDQNGKTYPTQKVKITKSVKPIAIPWSDQYRPVRVELEPRLVKLLPPSAREGRPYDIFIDPMIWEVYPPLRSGQQMVDEYKEKAPKAGQTECKAYFVGFGESLGDDLGFRMLNAGTMGNIDPNDLLPNPTPPLPPWTEVPDIAVPWRGTPSPGHRAIEYLAGENILGEAQEHAISAYTRCAGNPGSKDSVPGQWFLAYVPPHVYQGLPVVDVYGTWWKRSTVLNEGELPISVFVPDSLAKLRDYQPLTFQIPSTTEFLREPPEKGFDEPIIHQREGVWARYWYPPRLSQMVHRDFWAKVSLPTEKGRLELVSVRKPGQVMSDSTYSEPELSPPDPKKEDYKSNKVVVS